MTPADLRPWERLERTTALVYAALALGVCLAISLLLPRDGAVVALAPILSAAAAAGVYVWGTRGIRRRRRILRQPFPAEWVASRSAGPPKAARAGPPSNGLRASSVPRVSV